MHEIIPTCQTTPTDGVATNYTHWCSTHDDGADTPAYCKTWEEGYENGV